MPQTIWAWVHVWLSRGEQHGQVAQKWNVARVATYTVEDLTPYRTVIKATVSPFLSAGLLLSPRSFEPVVPTCHNTKPVTRVRSRIFVLQQISDTVISQLIGQDINNNELYCTAVHTRIPTADMGKVSCISEHFIQTSFNLKGISGDRVRETELVIGFHSLSTRGYACLAPSKMDGRS